MTQIRINLWVRRYKVLVLTYSIAARDRNKEYQNRVAEYILEGSEISNSKLKTPSKSRSKNLKTGYSVSSGSVELAMTSLQLSQINAQTDGGKSLNTNHEISKFSANNSSVFLKNFKEMHLRSLSQSKPKAVVQSKSRSREKPSVFSRLYRNASLKQLKQGIYSLKITVYSGPKPHSAKQSRSRSKTTLKSSLAR
jgi:hypothetical protein